MARGIKKEPILFSESWRRKQKKESSDCIAVIEGFLSVATTYSPTW